MPPLPFARPSRWSPRRLLTQAGLVAVLVPLAVAVAIPYLWMITASLKPRGAIGQPPYLYPVHFEVENYQTAWEAAPFPRYYLNTTVVAVAVVVSRVVLGGMAAYAFAFLKFPGRDGLFLLFLGTMMIPFQAILIPSYLIIRDLHWFNTFQALIVPRMVDAFGIFLLRQAFITLPQDYLDAARLDGATHWQTLWRVVMPLNRATVLTMALFAFLFIWNDFLWPLLVANDESMRLIQVGLQAFSGRYLTEWTYMMAGTVTATIPSILFFLLAQRFFVAGMARSGLRG